MLKPKYELIAAYAGCCLLAITNIVQENNEVLSILFLGVMFVIMYIEHNRKIKYLNKIKEIEESAIHFYQGHGLKFVSSTIVDSDEVIGVQYNRLVRFLGTVERNAKRNQQIINLMTTASDSPIVILNVKGEIEYANQSFRTWVEVPLLRRLTVSEVSSEVLKDVLQDALITEKRRTKMLVYEQKHYQTVANPIFDANYVFSGAVIIFHDITDLKKYQNLQKEFFSSVSHELKTPISAIKGCTEILLNGAKEEPEILDEFLTIIKDENDRMDHLVQDLMLLNRYENDQVQIQKVDIDLNEVLNSCVLDVLNFATLKHQKIRVQADEQAWILGDRIQLKHCFLNLLTNAIHYSSEHKTITVKLMVNEDNVTAQVIDEGIGIPAVDLNHIFERFYRVDKARARHTGGTGLGLSLVQSIVQAHEANIKVESKLEIGTTFTVVFKKSDKTGE